MVVGTLKISLDRLQKTHKKEFILVECCSVSSCEQRSKLHALIGQIPRVLLHMTNHKCKWSVGMTDRS